MWHTSINGTRSYKSLSFEGKAEYDNIKAVKQAIVIPVIANGDIDSARKAKFVLDYTGADAIMIGRAALGNPWLFQAVENLIEHNSISQMPSLNEKCGQILRHIQELHQFYGEQKKAIALRVNTWLGIYREFNLIPFLNRLLMQLVILKSS